MRKILPLGLVVILAAGCTPEGEQPVGKTQQAIAGVRDRVGRIVPINPELQEVGNAAQRAVGRAAASSATRSPRQMAQAVGQGTADVLCAGAAARGAATRTLADNADRQAGGVEGVGRATAAIRNLPLPSIGDPCRGN